jgi:glucosamine 6-phosphate synthetase-like amidotransferase/phosphosugar isomerase protein
MCGIAGYSLTPDASLPRTLAAQALLAGIAERGNDAVGYAHRGSGVADATTIKQRTGAAKLLERIHVPDSATHLLVHVRDYTKGHPSVPANNHPVRHGTVVGIHNGIIVNDDDVLAEFPCARGETRMSVDSEAIFALAAHSRADAAAFERLTGSMATAWLDERVADTIFVARGIGRPLWLGASDSGVFFASTTRALEIFEAYVRVELRKQEVREGTLLEIRDGEVVRQARFTPQPFVEEDPLPAVRAPREAEACLTVLQSLAAA